MRSSQIDVYFLERSTKLKWLQRCRTRKLSSVILITLFTSSTEPLHILFPRCPVSSSLDLIECLFNSEMSSTHAFVHFGQKILSARIRYYQLLHFFSHSTVCSVQYVIVDYETVPLIPQSFRVSRLSQQYVNAPLFITLYSQSENWPNVLVGKLQFGHGLFFHTSC